MWVIVIFLKCGEKKNNKKLVNFYYIKAQLDGNGNRVGSSNGNSVEVPSHDEEEAEEEWERREHKEASISPMSSNNEEDDEIV